MRGAGRQAAARMLAAGQAAVRQPDAEHMVAVELRAAAVAVLRAAAGRVVAAPHG